MRTANARFPREFANLAKNNLWGECQLRGELAWRIVEVNRLRPPDCLSWPAGLDPLAVWIAHSHSGSQFLQHLPWHSNSIMLPPHCGQTELMIEDSMLALNSPGIVCRVLMGALPFVIFPSILLESVCTMTASPEALETLRTRSPAVAIGS